MSGTSSRPPPHPAIPLPPLPLLTTMQSTRVSPPQSPCTSHVDELCSAKRSPDAFLAQNFQKHDADLMTSPNITEQNRIPSQKHDSANFKADVDEIFSFSQIWPEFSHDSQPQHSFSRNTHPSNESFWPEFNFDQTNHELEIALLQLPPPNMPERLDSFISDQLHLSGSFHAKDSSFSAHWPGFNNELSITSSRHDSFNCSSHSRHSNTVASQSTHIPPPSPDSDFDAFSSFSTINSSDISEDNDDLGDHLPVKSNVLNLFPSSWFSTSQPDTLHVVHLDHRIPSQAATSMLSNLSYPCSLSVESGPRKTTSPAQSTPNFQHISSQEMAIPAHRSSFGLSTQDEVACPVRDNPDDSFPISSGQMHFHVIQHHFDCPEHHLSSNIHATIDHLMIDSADSHSDLAISHTSSMSPLAATRAICHLSPPMIDIFAPFECSFTSDDSTPALLHADSLSDLGSIPDDDSFCIAAPLSCVNVCGNNMQHNNLIDNDNISSKNENFFNDSSSLSHLSLSSSVESLDYCILPPPHLRPLFIAEMRAQMTASNDYWSIRNSLAVDYHKMDDQDSSDWESETSPISSSLYDTICAMPSLNNSIPINSTPVTPAFDPNSCDYLYRYQQVDNMADCSNMDSLASKGQSNFSLLGAYLGHATLQVASCVRSGITTIVSNFVQPPLADLPTVAPSQSDLLDSPRMYYFCGGPHLSCFPPHSETFFPNYRMNGSRSDADGDSVDPQESFFDALSLVGAVIQRRMWHWAYIGLVSVMVCASFLSFAGISTDDRHAGSTALQIDDSPVAASFQHPDLWCAAQILSPNVWVNQAWCSQVSANGIFPSVSQPVRTSRVSSQVFENDAQSISRQHVVLQNQTPTPTNDNPSAFAVTVVAPYLSDQPEDDDECSSDQFFESNDIIDIDLISPAPEEKTSPIQSPVFSTSPSSSQRCLIICSDNGWWVISSLPQNDKPSVQHDDAQKQFQVFWLGLFIVGILCTQLRI